MRRLGAILASIVVVTSAVSGSAAELKWRSGRSSASEPSKTVAAQRFTRPRSLQYRADSSVRPAAFEDAGPQLTSGAEGQARLRSIVVDRGEAMDSTRSAQLPPSGTEAPGTGAGQTQPPDSQLDEELRSPFGDMPEEPTELETPVPGELDIDTMPIPEDRETLPPADTERQPADMLREPADGQIFAPPPSDFQPGVPPRIPTPFEREDIPTPSATAVEQEREKAETACTTSLTNLRANTIDKLSLAISVTGTEGEDYPFECSFDEGTWHAGRTWAQTTYLWKASALCHKPLYFEDEQLERYGHSWPPCCQPFVSGAHFFTRLPVLPYCMGVEPPMECVYTLGHYRPGNCAPYMCNPVPLSCRGALFQAGAVVGTAAVLP